MKENDLSEDELNKIFRLIDEKKDLTKEQIDCAISKVQSMMQRSGKSGTLSMHYALQLNIYYNQDGTLSNIPVVNLDDLGFQA